MSWEKPESNQVSNGEDDAAQSEWEVAYDEEGNMYYSNVATGWYRTSQQETGGGWNMPAHNCEGGGVYKKWGYFCMRLRSRLRSYFVRGKRGHMYLTSNYFALI